MSIIRFLIENQFSIYKTTPSFFYKNFGYKYLTVFLISFRLLSSKIKSLLLNFALIKGISLLTFVAKQPMTRV